MVSSKQNKKQNILNKIKIEIIYFNLIYLLNRQLLLYNTF